MTSKADYFFNDGPHPSGCKCRECQEECDHMEAEEDILIGRWTCFVCGKRWYS
jgi:hypothetical protein